MDTLQLTVNGMACGGCENAVKRSLGKLEGVESVTADHQTGLVGVDFDATRITAETIKEEIEAIGYSVAP